MKTISPAPDLELAFDVGASGSQSGAQTKLLHIQSLALPF